MSSDYIKVTAILSLVFAICPVPTLKAEDLRERVLSEYPDAVRRLETNFSRAELKGHGTLTGRIYKGTPKETTESYGVRFAIDHNLKRVICKNNNEVRKLDVPVERVHCMGPESAFSLKRMAEGSPYFVSNHGSSDSYTPTSVAPAIEVYLTQFLFAPFAILGRPMSRLLNQPTFGIKKVERIDDPERELLKVEYDLKDPDTMLRSGWIVVSPGQSWAICRGECQVGDKGKLMSFNVEYPPVQQDLPVPSRVSLEMPGPRQRMFTFDEITFEPTPAREFTLPYYGLPDFGKQGERRHESSASFWFFGLAFIALAVSIALSRLSRRFKTEACP